MDLITFRTHIEFGKQSVLKTPAGSVFRVLTGEEYPEDDRPEEPGVRLNDEKNKILILWEYEFCSVLFEDNKEGRDCIKRTVDILNKINKVAGIGDLASVELATHWILPVKGYEFKELELKYREAFLKNNELMGNCIDCSAVLTLACDSGTMYHQSGAMGIEQLSKDFRIFNFDSKENKLFFFLMTRMVSENVVQFSTSQMEESLSWSFGQLEKHASDFGRIMEATL